jgi:hypothetical protein
MRAIELVWVPKTLAESGSWKVVTGTAKMPATAFRMAKGHSYMLPRKWHWRVDGLTSEKGNFRLLTGYDPHKWEYKAWLGLVRERDCPIVAALEFHGSHGGWHCHVAKCSIAELDSGDTRPRYFSRCPRVSGKIQAVTFEMSEPTALAKAFKFFRVGAADKGELGL